MNNGLSEGILDLVRRSAVKHPPLITGFELNKRYKERQVDKMKELESKDKLTPKDRKFIKRSSMASERSTAVEYVNIERRKEGLPQHSEEEGAIIEEKLARKELAKGAGIVSDIDSYLDTQTFSRKIVTANWAERVAKELVEWINKPRGPEELQPIKVTEFFKEKGIFFRDFHKISKKYEILDAALKYANQALGDIRERNMLEGKWNPTVGMFTMGQYDPNWREEQERREAAKVKQAEATGVDFKALMLDMTTPVLPTEEVREKLAKDKKS